VSQALADLEDLLSRSCPAPREEFVRELERAMPGQWAEHDRRRLRIVLAGCGLATVLAAVAIGLSVVGLLPFTSGGSRAQADRDCRTVSVERSERQPYFVLARNGDVEVRYRVERVPRLVRRCR
jgi:hypothetical protein